MDYNVPRRGARTPERKAPAEPAPAPAPAPTVAQRSKPPTKTSALGNNSRIVTGIIATIVLLALAGLLWFGYKQFVVNGSLVDRDKYQAVFLNNGQVYFGNLQNSRGDYLVLKNIIYPQAPDAAVNTSESENDQDLQNQSSSDIQFIKLGTEIHGPTDEMVINRDQVLFFQNLKDEGKVAELIKQYEAANNN